MLQNWHIIKGYVAGMVAFVACPCHLPFTLPLVISLTAGTAISAWLGQNVIAIYAVATILFLGGLILAGKWSMQDDFAVIPAIEGPADIVIVTSRTCKTCDATTQFWEALQSTHRFRYQRVDITSDKGRALAAKHNILSTPTTLINSRVAFRGLPDRRRAIAAVS